MKFTEASPFLHHVKDYLDMVIEKAAPILEELRVKPFKDTFGLEEKKEDVEVSKATST